MLTVNCEPDPITAHALGTGTVENRAPFARRVMQVMTIPLRESDNYRIGQPVSVLDSGTGQPERCQVDSWAIRYPSGAERIIRVHYPAVLAASQLRNVHTFEASDVGALPLSFQPAAPMLTALQRMSVVFFCGPKATHYVPLYTFGATPAEIAFGPQMTKFRYFARLYEPAHAPTLRTQFWCEMELHLYHDQNHALAFFRWGVDDPRVNSFFEDRRGLTLGESEVGFDIYTTDSVQGTARLQPCYPQSNTHSLTWDQANGRWRWIWDQTTRNESAVALNETYPWGLGATARCVITANTGETNQQRLDSVAAWHAQPAYHFGISNEWVNKGEAWVWGVLPRIPKMHEHFAGTARDAAYIRGQLELEYWNNAATPMTRYIEGGAHYSWNHRASSRFEGIWHPPDGQGPGTHGYWNKNAFIEAALYSVPGVAHYPERCLATCPWPYFYREQDGRVLTALDYPAMGSNRGTPTPGHGKTGDRPAYGVDSTLLKEPTTGARLVGADGAHFEGSLAPAHAALFGSDLSRHLAQSLLLGPLHLGNWNTARFGAVGEGRQWARGNTVWAWTIWLFGNNPAVVNRCADVFLAINVRPSVDATDATYPGRVTRVPFYQSPRIDAPTRVELNFRFNFRPWEIGHAVGEWHIARMAKHLRPEFSWFEDHARGTARDIWRYGTPRRVNEETGVVEYTFTPDGVYEPAICIAMSYENGLPSGTRALTAAELADNNWSQCNGQRSCANPPQSSGNMLYRTGVSSSSFVNAMGWLVHDGPLSLGDIVLTRYVDVLGTARNAADPRVSDRYTQWFNEMYRWGVGRMDAVVQAAAVQRGNHGQTLRGIAISQIVPRHVWTLEPNAPLLARRNVDTGTIAEGQDPTPFLADPTNLCTLTLAPGSVPMVALLKANWSGNAHVIYMTQESGIFAGPPLDMVFLLPDDEVADLRAICWMPQLQRFLIGGRSITHGGAAVWSVGILQPVARRESLPLASVADARILLDLTEVMHATATPDGKLLILADASGNRHAYIWNSESGHYGAPRHKFQGDTWCALSLHARDDDALRIITASDGATFWDHAI